MTSESIFNDIFVNAILDPSSERVWVQDFHKVLTEAYNEATTSLQKKYENFSVLVQEVY